ncbi:peptidoglycan/LPS O-acetylase OafA/YrhL [Pseudoduganella lurida]|uniref:Peptidoglycan/LPS O-acetylase OafA/YrhL n=1 Tax=Pseudoduganella lurida TaxID=1036180 RepID=A0A562QXJ8_9BURK|nr:acyltransferase [Pseudoduganella lurida]TWI61505.1 peptidoglycan/LPS O-acetylase OafA/YrhL [Pseudoduganella lurida]
MDLPTARRNNFNLLRLVLALLVLLSHAAELQDGTRQREPLTRLFHTLSFGELAVDGFFLLSGYLIVQSWDSAPAAWTFLRKRVLRIYPGFLVASLVCVFLVAPLGSDPVRYFAELSGLKVLLAMAVLHGPILPPVFDGLPYPQVNGAMWTIMREFACYLGVLGMGLAGGIRRRRVWLALTVAALLTHLATRYGLPITWTPLRLLLGDPIVRLASLFLAGGCFYLYRERCRFTPVGAVLAGCVLGVAMFSPRWAELALATCGGYLLFYAALTPLPVLAGFNRLPDISYGVYLYGWPVQTLLVWYLPPLSPWHMFLLAGAAVLPLALLSWYLVEQPLLRLKPGAPRKAHPAGSYT